ncbi:TonB-dependent receptor domain-containing protein [Sphingosinicella xenopeptidilytica]|uniref:TonB-dependent receptor domain-containing protein n=1 Tax=Sphingosinicella xenopeptidilytica TaxID=364098 RepID=A0ABW3C5V9_SPHXN
MTSAYTSVSTWVLLAALATCGTPSQSPAAVQSAPGQSARLFFNIPAQRLASALAQFSRQSRLGVLMPGDLVRDRMSTAISGEMTPHEALVRLSAGTGLRVVVLPDGGFTLVTEKVRANKESNRARLEAAGSAHHQKGGIRSSSIESEAAPEVIVTAQKREERLQDVPVPVTSIDALKLVAHNQLRLEDYQTQVPGLRVTPAGEFGQILSIRGITAGGLGGNPAVAITLDEQQLGSSTALGYGLVIPDLDPRELERVEVLRGPQGTLYGANSLGGLVKYVLSEPVIGTSDGLVEASVHTVQNGPTPGYSIHASTNIAVQEQVAVRISGFEREDAGYIDNDALELRSVNRQKVFGGRLSLLWRPTTNFSATLNALYQNFDAEGGNDVNPSLGDLKQEKIVGTGRNKGAVGAYSLKLRGSFAQWDLISVSGYSNRTAQSSIDHILRRASVLALYGVGGAELVNISQQRKFSQEFRASGTLSEGTDILLGAYYTYEHAPIEQTIYARELTSERVVGVPYHSTFLSTYNELAAFANLTFRVSPAFDVQFGGRASAIRQSFQQTTLSLFASEEPSVGDVQRARAHPVNYMITPRYRITPELILYGRLASGYRPGGANVVLCSTYSFPCQYAPDKTINREIGIKGDLLDGKIYLDTSLYWIDWKNIQLFTIDPIGNQGYRINGSGALSRGIELSLTLMPGSGLELTGWGVLADAELTKPFPSGTTVRGAVGDKLPFSSHFTGGVTIDKKLKIGSAGVSLGGSFSYVGYRQGGFASASDPAGIRPQLPGYTRTDLRASVRFSEWKIDVFLNNITDERGVLVAGSDLFYPSTVYIKPRTLGISLSRSL